MENQETKYELLRVWSSGLHNQCISSHCTNHGPAFMYFTRLLVGPQKQQEAQLHSSPSGRCVPEVNRVDQ